MTALHELTVAELSKALRTRTVSSVELVRALLARIEQHQQGLNAFISILHEEALAEAARADARLAAGDEGAVVQEYEQRRGYHYFLGRHADETEIKLKLKRI